MSIRVSCKTVVRLSIAASLLVTVATTKSFADSTVENDTGQSVGRIEAESFSDSFDTDSVNRGGAHSEKGVDIEVTGDIDGEFSVGWTVAGEWLEYDIDVAATARYRLNARIASAIAGGQLNFTVDGLPLAVVNVPDTGDWQAWQTVTIDDLNLTAGSHKLRVTWAGTGFGNLNWFSLIQQEPERPQEISFQTSDQQGREGEPFQIEIRLSRPSTEDEQVTIYTRPGTAINGSDFYGLYEIINFSAGETLKTIDVQLLDDDDVEPEEVFYHHLVNGSRPIAQTRASNSIVDDDSDGGNGAPVDYESNLARLLASSYRNKLEDDSPFIYTPSVDLYDEPSLYTTGGEYLKRRGGYNQDEYFDGGYYPGNGAGTFRASCEVSHFSYDDPMIFPNQPEKAHLHMFVGNTHANAYSTYDTLMNSGGSTCNGAELNRTSYWIPAMFDGKGNVVVPYKVLFYYKTEKPAGIGKVKTYPENLQLLGTKKNNIQDNLDLATFRCNNIYNGAKGQPSANIPNCPAIANGFTGAVELLVYFDYCWNGDESTIGDWKSNRDTNFTAPLRFWHSSECPASHPVLLPALVTHIFYDMRPDDDTSKWYMSSDVNPKTRKLEMAGGAHAHADWFGAWNKEVNAEWVRNCSNIQDAECMNGTLADTEGDPNSTVRALRLRKDFVAGSANASARMPVKGIYEQMCSVGDDFSPDQGGAQGAWCRP